VLFVAGNKLTTSANTIFLQSTAPLYLLLLGPWLLAERARRSDLLVLAVAACGLALFLVQAEPVQRTAPDPVQGNLCALGSGVCWAFTLVGLRWLSSGPTGGSAPWTFPIRGVRPLDGLLIAYLGVFQIGLAYALLVRGMRNARALEASLLLLLEPALNPIWTWLVHRETPSSWALAGGALVLAATTGKSVFDMRR